MRLRSRDVAVDGHVAWQMVDQRLSSSERRRRVGEQLAAEPRAGPSSRLRMCVFITSGCRSEKPVAPPCSAAIVVVVVVVDEAIFFE